MNLHFICTGNVFRSRLAECYTRYLLKNHPQFVITSSGVNASNAQNGPIAWSALKIIANNELLPYMSSNWNQTTPEILKAQDKVIFMQPWHYEQCRLRFDYQATDHEIWDIPDTDSGMTDEEIISFTETQFQKIKIKVEELVNKLIIAKS